MNDSSVNESSVNHEEHDDRGAFFIEHDGKRIAEMTYRRNDSSRATINHTQVDDSLRGQGVSRRLLDAAVKWARETGTRLDATCTYAIAQFDKDPTIRDVRA